MSGRYRSVIAAYVRGKDRVWEVDRMRAATTPEAGSRVEWGRIPGSPRFGIGVARTLDFERGPAMRTDGGAARGASSDG